MCFTTPPIASHYPLQDDPLATEPDPTPAALAPTSNSTPVHDDLEAEKRRQRAARFGIPVIEPPKPRPSHAARNPSARNGTKQPQSLIATADVWSFPSQPRAFTLTS